MSRKQTNEQNKKNLILHNTLTEKKMYTVGYNFSICGNVCFRKTMSISNNTIEQGKRNILKYQQCIYE